MWSCAGRSLEAENRIIVRNVCWHAEHTKTCTLIHWNWNFTLVYSALDYLFFYFFKILLKFSFLFCLPHLLLVLQAEIYFTFVSNKCCFRVLAPQCYPYWIINYSLWNAFRLIDIQWINNRKTRQWVREQDMRHLMIILGQMNGFFVCSNCSWVHWLRHILINALGSLIWMSVEPYCAGSG